MQRRSFLVGLIAAPIGYACAQHGGNGGNERTASAGESSSAGSGWPGPDRPVSYVRGDAPPVGERLELSSNEWRERLTETQFYILREKGTERPFSGDLEDHGPGVYHCAGCGAPLFRSDTKFDSGTGWPSFHTSIPARVAEETDRTLGMAHGSLVCTLRWASWTRVSRRAAADRSALLHQLRVVGVQARLRHHASFST